MRFWNPLGEESAQSTVEYAAVLIGLLAMVLALAVLWRAASAGVFAELVERAASHAMDAWGAIDIALF